MTSGLCRFLVITDTHLGGRTWGVHNPGHSSSVAASVEKLRLEIAQKEIAFVVHLGDLTHDGTDEQIAEARDLFVQMGCPVYALLGNHDAVSEDRGPAWTGAWPEAFPGGRPYYAWNQGDLRCIALQAHYVDPAGTLQPYWVWEKEGGWPDWRIPSEQLTWLERELIAASGKPTLLFTHCSPLPLTRPDEPEAPLDAGAAPLLEVIARHPQVVAVFGGHLHGHRIALRGKTAFITCGSLAEFPFEGRLVTIAPDGLHIETLSVRDHTDATGQQPATLWPAGAESDRRRHLPIQR